MWKSIKQWAKKLKLELKALQVAIAENLVPWYVKVLIIITLGYAFSPIDLIPDFIPVLGLLDDLIIVPILIYLSVKLIPKNVMEECRIKAGRTTLKRKNNWIAGMVVIGIWLAVVFWLMKTFGYL